MRKLALFFLALFGIGLFAFGDAEARRMGGGSNLGKQYNVPSQSARPSAPTAGATSPTSPTPATGGASRWLGPLAGIAAGGLLAALLFGDGFEGLQILDFLLVAALAIGAVMLFRRLRRGATPALAAAGAQGSPYQRQATDLSLDKTPLSSSAAETLTAAPPWFDETRFLDGAKRHFVDLQAAWDVGNLEGLREYCTPELFADLTRERSRLGAERQETEVVTLEARLASLQRDGDLVVASILFSGLIREGAGGRPQSFREIWHVAHNWASPAGDWHLSGIQQVTD